ncbi:MAG: DUF1858 domain-containing protein [Acidithiobacillus sp.]|jgi:hybrid cluster-associated redox disulfide protein|uniref:DUF1858 domain-containing protein n=1 Tax=Acidithiobacillus sp. TaxID=1872118 RepID=UPI0025B7CC54|nr:DUF1858 domain-containing protein [Acidithiobacillus sp.]
MILDPAQLHRPIGELLQDYPQLRDLLARRGIHCEECFIADRETLAGMAAMHDLDLQELLRELDSGSGASTDS